jgi:hypothetical protein
MSFTDADTAKLEKAAEADARIRRGDHFSDWLALGTGLITLRDVAMREARTNIPQGRTYTGIMGRMMQDHPWANRDKATKSHAMWLADNAGAIIAWRDTLAQNKREQLNHPSVIKRNFERMMLVREAKPKDADAKPSPQERIKDLEGRLADAEERNAHLEGKVDGGTFDLDKDSLADIKAVIDRLPHTAARRIRLTKIRAIIDSWLAVEVKR